MPEARWARPRPTCPEYWSHVSKRLVPFTEISVRCDDGTYYAKFLVLDCGPGWAKVHLLNWWDLVAADAAAAQSPAGSEDDYEIVWKNNTLKHVVIRRADQQLMHSGEARKTAAQEWLKDHLSKKVHTQAPDQLAA